MSEVSAAIIRCATCAFWGNIDNADGRCRRHAPEVAQAINEVAHWPLTRANAFCGEGSVAADADAGLIKCNQCAYWHHDAGGIEPVQKRDQLAPWWANAGHCTRFAPRPSPEPGARAFWYVSHADDACFDGRLKT